MLLFYTIILISVSYSFQSSQDSSVLSVVTRHGMISGHQIETKDPRTGEHLSYARFPTIPYAKPPVGDLRFAPTQPLDPGEIIDTRNVSDRRTCHQLAGLSAAAPDLAEADEDCLYLYINVPGTWPPPEPLPVLIWFTGGAFVFGSGNWYGVDFWMPHDVIIVAVNYRLGPFGFLTLGLEDAPGNQGLLDQRQSMVWVQENIRDFMGDPDRVTIGGESAGSFSVFYHMMSPGSQGLYQRIIGQSGMGALSPSFHHWQPEQGIRFGNEVALVLGCLNIDIHKELECLKTKSPLALLEMELADGIISQPVIDSDFSANPFFPKDPLEILENGEFTTDVEILMGSNKNEGILLTEFITGFDHLLFNTITNNWDIWGPLLLFHKHYLEISEDDVQKAYHVLEHYCGTVDVTTDHIVNMTEMFTDSYFLYGITKYIDDYYLKYSSKPLYQYINSYHNEEYQLNFFIYPPMSPKLPGVSHGDELFIQWSPFAYLPLELSVNDTEASLQMTSLWTEFIKNGNPGGGWNPVVQDNKQFLDFNLDPKMESRSENYEARMDFWKSIY